MRIIPWPIHNLLDILDRTIQETKKKWLNHFCLIIQGLPEP